MKKTLLSFLLAALTLTATADNFKLQTHNDTLSYAMGIVFAGELGFYQEDHLSTEEALERFFTGLEESLAGAIDNHANPAEQSKSYAVGGIYAVFFCNGIEHSDGIIIVEDLLEGLNDGVAKNYSRMDTVQCKQFLSKFSKLSKKKQKADTARLKTASYAFGLLRASSNEQGIREALTEYDVPEEEQNIQEFWDGYITTATTMLAAEANSYYFGKSLGESILGTCDEVNLQKNIQLSPSIILQGFKDKMAGLPLLIPKEKTEEVKFMFGYTEEDPVTDIEDQE